MRHTGAVGGSRVYKVDIIAITAAHHENMAGYTHNNRIPLVRYSYQIHQCARRMSISFKTEIIGDPYHAWLSPCQTIIGIPHSHILFLLQDFRRIVVASVGIHDLFQRNT